MPGATIVGLDPDAAVVAGLNGGRPPLFEPGLEELVRRGLASGRLQFTDRVERVADADVVWVTFDTPVNQDDEADVDARRDVDRGAVPASRRRRRRAGSSQVPVGFCARLERAFADGAAGRRVAFACSPENLRLGRAIEVFRNPERIVVGARTAEARARICGSSSSPSAGPS